MAIVKYNFCTQIKGKGNRVNFSLVTCDSPNHEGNRERLITNSHLNQGVGENRCRHCNNIEKSPPRKKAKDFYILLGQSKGLVWMEEEIPKDTRVSTRWKCVQCNKEYFRSASKIANWKLGCKNCLSLSRKKIYFSSWSKKIKKIYKQCQKCGNKDSLQAHHIFNKKDFPELIHEIGNGITLCKICHIRFHSIFSKSKNNKSQIMSFLSEKYIPSYHEINSFKKDYLDDYFC